MDHNKEFDFEAFKKQAIEGMYAGRPLNGEKGIFAPLLKHFLEAALEGELQAHLQEVPCRQHSCTSAGQPQVL